MMILVSGKTEVCGVDAIGHCAVILQGKTCRRATSIMVWGTDFICTMCLEELLAKAAREGGELAEFHKDHGVLERVKDEEA